MFTLTKASFFILKNYIKKSLSLREDERIFREYLTKFK